MSTRKFRIRTTSMITKARDCTTTTSRPSVAVTIRRPMPGIEDVLDDHGAGEQLAELKSCHRDQRDRCVAHTMDKCRATPGPTSCHCRPDEILVHHIDHRRADIPREDRRDAETQREHR